MNMQPLIQLAERVRDDGSYTYEHFARDLVQRLSWTGAVDVATALRSHVYGSPGRSELQTDVRPIYDRLGWDQAALLASWFRDSRNWPQKRSRGWPIATDSSELETP